MESNKYQLEDYLRVLQNRFSICCEIDLAENKLGQRTVRLRRKINEHISLDLYVFGYDFSVIYKPNGRTVFYEKRSPNQIAQVVFSILKYYNCLDGVVAV